MLTHKKLNIWTIILHGLILIAGGHGGAFFFLFEIFSILQLKEANFSLSFSSETGRLLAVTLIPLLGQIAIIISLLVSHQKLKLKFHIPGICLLGLSVIYFGYNASNNSYPRIVWFTALPFFICIILTFTGQYLKRFYNWLGENL